MTDNFIEDSDSPYNSPVWVVPKKPDPDGNKRWRMVIDFRKLNEKTVKDAYPLPNITHILDQLGGAQYFSTLDLAMGFHQIKMHPNSKAKTGFSTLYGHYHYNRMPFGLKNAPATFQRLMDKILSGLQGVELFVYMDDIVIYANSLEEHTRKFRILLERLDKANLTLQPEKCLFLRKEVCYLGHVITQEGVKPDPKKVEAVRKFPQPRNAKNIKQFLGLAGYYRRFIPDFSTIAKPLSFLLKKNVLFKWTNSQHESFNKLKDILCTHPLLQYPDFSKPFIVSCDASNYGIGGVLNQNFDGKNLPIAYASRTLSDVEINYATIEKELLAILFSVETFRPYLYGRKFTLETDHRPLVWLHNVKNPNSKLVRWRYRLNEYDYEIIYKKGITNLNADALSRNPCDNIMQSHHDIIEDIKLSEESDPLDSLSTPRHKVLIPLNRTPVSLQYPPECIEDDIRVENAFLETNIEYNDMSKNKNKYFPCQVIKESINEPDSSDEAFETANEYSDDEADQLIIRLDHEEDDPSKGGCNCVAKRMSLGREAIPSKASCDCTTHIEGKVYPTWRSLSDLMMSEPAGRGAIPGKASWTALPTLVSGEDDVESEEAISESAGRGAIPGKTSWTALPTPVSDSDSGDGDKVVSEIRINCDDYFILNDTNISGSFESGDSTRKYLSKTVGRTQIFMCDPYTILTGNENKIARKITHPCLPVAHDDSTFDNPQRNEETIENMAEFLSNSDEPFSPTSEFSCIQISKEKLFMRDDNLVLFIPADCRLTTETGQELIKQNRLKYEDLQKEDTENLQVGNVIVIKYENHCVFNIIIKQSFDSKPYLVDIVAALWALKHAMDELKIESVSISRTGNGLNQISWSSIEDELRKLFGQANYKLTICYGEVETPPETDRENIIREHHCSVMGGHKGSTKTYDRIRENFYWPNMREQIRKFVRECETCKLNKTVRIKTKAPMQITDTPSEAFEKIEMDIVGPLPQTEYGNKYILTIQDNLTKYSDAIPLRSTESTAIASAFAEHFITRFGCPRVIHTDQGSDFTSQVMATFCKIFRIKHLRSTAFHPQALGSLERSHHVLIQYLKNYCEKNNWDRWLRFALFSYNTSKHEGTGFTPHELIFGKTARIPSEFAKTQLPLTYNLYLKTLAEKLVKTQEEARERLHAAKERSKKYYDKKLNAQTYAIGDPVYLQNNTKSSKLDCEYSGPYKIIQIFNDNNVELDLGKQRTRIVHMNRLRPQTLKIFPDSL